MVDNTFGSLAPSIRDEKFHWSLPVAIDSSNLAGSVDQNIQALEKVYQDVCCTKALFFGEDIHCHAAMIHQAMYVLKEIRSACMAQ